tara:strand:- start:353 stop:562 length:210 start_codon:yes stop_codon:yes gene_type:complete
VKVGDLVKFVEHSAIEYENMHAGLVLEIDVSMWGDEHVPAGVKVLWCKTGASELVYEDEVQVISEAVTA